MIIRAMNLQDAGGAFEKSVRTIIIVAVASNGHQDDAEAIPKTTTNSKTTPQDAAADVTAARIRQLRAIHPPVHRLRRNGDRVAVLVKSNPIRRLRLRPRPRRLHRPGRAVATRNRVQTAILAHRVGVPPVLRVLRVLQVLQVRRVRRVPPNPVRVHPHGANVFVHRVATVK